MRLHTEIRSLPRVATGAIALVIALLTGSANAAVVDTYKPAYLPPEEILQTVGALPTPSGAVLRWEIDRVVHEVEFLINGTANLLVMSGTEADVDAARELLRQIDIAPRQIVIDALIVEVNESKAREIGIDWDRLLRDNLPRGTIQFRDDHQESSRTEGSNSLHSEVDTDSRTISANTQFNLGETLRLLDETGTGTVRGAPRVLTLNNKPATILDGQRVTYITRYSSYTNLYVTDSMDAGLTLSVVPSLGESGYLTIEVNAELTSLAGEISGSPVKDGQIIQNTVIVKDGESVLLGGQERVTKSTTRRRFPLLGHVLPFLFSRESSSSRITRSYVILTPHVVDLAGVVDVENPDALPSVPK